ncbi:protein TEX261 [Galendromus occidentalis]|uniref:Protein TEX261 n=1 Tax=Galendromus occidentalis TaxID=34638 RepID=A0AAJ6QMD2_9ACAR|nr:protein TEX261 [Galendromus occidentalis]
MLFLTLLSWISSVFQIFVLVFCLACGLYYLAELVEEFTAATARVIRCLILIVITIHIGFVVFENFPLWMMVCGLLDQGSHLLVLKTFPLVDVTSPSFIAGLVLLVYNHYQAFSYFGANYHPMSEVLAYFILCLWIVPCAFLVSLSANDSILPTTAERTLLVDNGDSFTSSSYFSNRGPLRKYNLLGLFKSARESVLPQRVKRAF